MNADIRKLCAGSGYLIAESPDDTANVLCRHGHIYSDGARLIASLDGWQDNPTTKSECIARGRTLRKLGAPIMDGDFGELSVACQPARFREVARLMKPRQAAAARRAA